MKRQLNITIEEDLINVAKQYAKQNYTSVSQLIRNYLLQLKRELERSEQEEQENAGGMEGKTPPSSLPRRYDSSKTSPIKTK
jgi:hypothetical protein